MGQAWWYAPVLSVREEGEGLVMSLRPAGFTLRYKHSFTMQPCFKKPEQTSKVSQELNKSCDRF